MIAPDSGSRYITKCYSDEWMRDNGFLSPARTHGSLRDLLSRKPKTLYVCRPGETVQSAISRSWHAEVIVSTSCGTGTVR